MELERPSGRKGAPQHAVAATSDAVQAQAEALWPQIATQLGLPVSDARFRRLQVNSRRQLQRSVLEITAAGGQRYVLRADIGVPLSDHFERVLDRHIAAAQNLRARPGISAPEVLWRAPDSPCFLMEYAPGDTAFRTLDATDYGLGNRADVLHQLGQAVAGLHDVSALGTRQFWPKSLLARVTDQARAARSGQLKLPRPHKFLGLCALLHRLGRAARGREFIAAVEHGDLHLRNILMSPERVSFIDFSNHKGIFPQRDLATIWLANCPDHLARDGRAPGYGLVAQADWQAFQAGYGQDLVGDPVFRFFYALRLFNAWLLLVKQHGAAEVPAEPGLGERAQEKTLRRADQFVEVFNALLSAEADG